MFRHVQSFLCKESFLLPKEVHMNNAHFSLVLIGVVAAVFLITDSITGGYHIAIRPQVEHPQYVSSLEQMRSRSLDSRTEQQQLIGVQGDLLPEGVYNLIVGLGPRGGRQQTYIELVDLSEIVPLTIPTPSLTPTPVVTTPQPVVPTPPSTPVESVPAPAVLRMIPGESKNVLVGGSTRKITVEHIDEVTGIITLSIDGRTLPSLNVGNFYNGPEYNIGIVRARFTKKESQASIVWVLVS
jgi:hypothetical protein